MKVVILAGGMGTRLAEATEVLPKPMVQIGGRPILWHIMKIYSHPGFDEFIVCLGYKGYIIKEYFVNYFTENVRHHRAISARTRWTFTANRTSAGRSRWSTPV